MQLRDRFNGKCEITLFWITRYRKFFETVAWNDPVFQFTEVKYWFSSTFTYKDMRRNDYIDLNVMLEEYS